MKQLDAVNLPETFAQTVRTTVDIPKVIRQDYIQAQDYPLQYYADAHSEAALGRPAQERAGKLHILLSRMLACTIVEHGHAGRALFEDRVRRFYRGEWLSLIQEAASHGDASGPGDNSRNSSRRPRSPGPQLNRDEDSWRDEMRAAL